MSARLNPRLWGVLLAVLALCAFVAAQPSADEDLAVQGHDRPADDRAVEGQGGRPSRAGAREAAHEAAGRTNRDPAGSPGPTRAARSGVGAARAASQPTPAQARELVAWSGAWARRAAEPWAAAPPDARWSWAPLQPPPPPPPPAREAAPPMAPPFPYAWVGRFVDEVPRAVIAGPNGTWVLRQGEVIEGQWRLGAIAERQLTVTYLPLSQDQTVPLK